MWLALRRQTTVAFRSHTHPEACCRHGAFICCNALL